jgi:hypothetical protein
MAPTQEEELRSDKGLSSPQTRNSGYELCHRVLRRFIRERAASPEDVDRMAFQDLIRTANQQGLLLSGWPAWHRCRDVCACTSHTYRVETARQVVEAIPGSLAEAEYLRDEMRKRLA